MLLRLAALLLALAAAPAAVAGLRAVYVPGMGESAEIRIADNGDIDAELSGGRRLFVRGGHAFVVEERLTGPIVHRLEDLEALAGDRPTEVLRPSPSETADPSLVA